MGVSREKLISHLFFMVLCPQLVRYYLMWPVSKFTGVH